VVIRTKRLYWYAQPNSWKSPGVTRVVWSKLQTKHPAIALHGLMIPPPRFGDGGKYKMLGTKFVPLSLVSHLFVSQLLEMLVHQYSLQGE
jgi:hypothetical protein